MSKSIPLSPKHGANPTIKTCAWCGKSTNEILLMGKLPGDKEAPKYAVVDYEPCDKCKAAWKQGVAILEVTQKCIDSRPHITQTSNGVKFYPTLRYVVITREAASSLQIPRDKNTVYMNTAEFEKVFGEFCNRG